MRSCEECNGDELGFDGIDDDDEVPLVQGVLRRTFSRIGELGLLEGGGVFDKVKRWCLGELFAANPSALNH
ncbi:hypothetical protein Tco_0385581 [Tanacetum coccineum]